MFLLIASTLYVLLCIITVIIIIKYNIKYNIILINIIYIYFINNKMYIHMLSLINNYNQFINTFYCVDTFRCL